MIFPWVALKENFICSFWPNFDNYNSFDMALKILQCKLMGWEAALFGN